MQYLFVTWEHNFKDEPKEFYMELDDTRFQERVLEIFEDGEVAYATTTEEYNTFLAKESYPSIEEINSTEEFRAALITKEEFEKAWKNRDKQK
ncbi:hypothetical protein EXM65_16505 [Clostridium botulinum]|uniref:DUF6881 domain-containing protein n=1 Tax=Clostridium botulinum TaxID=1491 RepID=A0A6M0ST31_CLOBO|nr:hypothetical protein [Clostridium botulinum]NFA44127.1 hypothetical protein [Clostridium botulinum]